MTIATTCRACGKPMNTDNGFDICPHCDAVCRDTKRGCLQCKSIMSQDNEGIGPGDRLRP